VWCARVSGLLGCVCLLSLCVHARVRLLLLGLSCSMCVCVCVCCVDDFRLSRFLPPGRPLSSFSLSLFRSSPFLRSPTFPRLPYDCRDVQRGQDLARACGGRGGWGACDPFTARPQRKTICFRCSRFTNQPRAASLCSTPATQKRRVGDDE